MPGPDRNPHIRRTSAGRDDGIVLKGDTPTFGMGVKGWLAAAGIRAAGEYRRVFDHDIQGRSESAGDASNRHRISTGGKQVGRFLAKHVLDPQLIDTGHENPVGTLHLRA